MLEFLPLFLGTIVTGAAAAEPDRDALAGDWTVAEAEREGTAAPDLVGHVLTFEGDGFVIHDAEGSRLAEGRYTVDPTHEPRRIDFEHEGGTVWRGVYRLDGNALTVVDNAANPKAERPEGFAAPARSGLVLLGLKRAGVR